MKTTTGKQTRHNGFTIEIHETTELGLAMLIAESQDGKYRPIAVVSSVAEAREMAQSNFENGAERLDAGETPFRLRAYKVWARGLHGDYRVAAEIAATILTGKPRRTHVR